MNGGFLVSVEGLDGSGKSTLCDSLAVSLSEMFHRAVYQTSAISNWTTGVGKAVGALLRDPYATIDSEAEMLLMTAARVQVWHEKIKPALDAGGIVIADRHNLSMAVYQRRRDGSFHRGDDIRAHLRTWGIAQDADINILLDVDPTRPLASFAEGTNRLENRPIYEWQRMRQVLQCEHWLLPRGVVINVNENDAQQVHDIALDHIIESRRGM